MLLNIILSTFLLAAVGSVAHNLVGGSGSLLHNAFVGFMGFVLADIVCRIFNYYSYGIIRYVLFGIAGSCVWILFVNEVKARYFDENKN